MVDMNEIEDLIRDLAARWDELDDADAPELGRRLRAAVEAFDQEHDKKEGTNHER